MQMGCMATERVRVFDDNNPFTLNDGNANAQSARMDLHHYNMYVRTHTRMLAPVHNLLCLTISDE